MQNLKSKVVHSLKWVAISKLVIQLFRWLSTFLVIRLLVPDDYAVIAISDMVAGYILAFSSLGLGALLVSKNKVSPLFMREMMCLSVAVNIVLFILQVMLSDVIAGFYNNEAVGHVLKASALCYLFNIFSLIPSSMMARDMRFKEISVIEIFAGVLSALTVIIMAWAEYSYWSLIGGYLVNEVIKTVLFIKAYRYSFKPAIPRKRSLKLMRYCLSLSLSEVIFHSRDSIDVLIGGLFMNKTQLGTYNVGLQVSSMPLRKIAPPLRKVALPALSSVKSNTQLLGSYLAKIQRMSFFITIPIFWGLASTVDLILPPLLGEKWLTAVPIVSLLCLVMPFRFAEEMLHPILKSKQKGKEMLICNLSGLIIFGALVLYGAQSGLMGMALAWIISAPLIYGFSSLVVSRMMKFQLASFAYEWFYPVLAGASMLSVVEVIKQNAFMGSDVLTFITSAMFGATTYLAVIFFLRRNLMNEVLALKSS